MRISDTVAIFQFNGKLGGLPQAIDVNCLENRVRSRTFTVASLAAIQRPTKPQHLDRNASQSEVKFFGKAPPTGFLNTILLPSLMLGMERI